MSGTVTTTFWELAREQMEAHQEVLAACAACFSVIARHNLADELEQELKARGVKEGFGVRSELALAHFLAPPQGGQQHGYCIKEAEMKVIAKFKDGQTTEIEFQVRYPAAEAIERAKEELGDEAEEVKEWEVEEDFL